MLKELLRYHTIAPRPINKIFICAPVILVIEIHHPGPIFANQHHLLTKKHNDFLKDNEKYYIYIYLIGENFVGENFVGGNFRRWKFSSVEMFRRWKFFIGGNFSSVEIFHRWKFPHFAKFSTLSTDENV